MCLPRRAVMDSLRWGSTDGDWCVYNGGNWCRLSWTGPGWVGVFCQTPIPLLWVARHLSQQPLCLTTCSLHWAWQPSFKCHLIFIFKYNYKVFTARYQSSANVSGLICASSRVSTVNYCVVSAWLNDILTLGRLSSSPPTLSYPFLLHWGIDRSALSHTWWQNMQIS